jgi:hypothetical protein
MLIQHQKVGNPFSKCPPFLDGVGNVGVDGSTLQLTSPELGSLLFGWI